MPASQTLQRRAPWIACFGVLGLLLVAAAERPASHVGIVDAERIRTDSAFVRGRLAEISKPAEEIKTKLLAKRTEIQSAIDQYQAQATALSEDAKKAKMTEIQKLRGEGETLSNSFTESLNKAESQDVEMIRGMIMGIVKDLAAERGMDVVLSTNNILYNAPACDLTGAVIQRLDAAPAQKSK